MVVGLGVCDDPILSGQNLILFRIRNNDISVFHTVFQVAPFGITEWKANSVPMICRRFMTSEANSC